MRFQCTFCFTIIKHSTHGGANSVPCPSCNKRVAVPRSSFEAGCVIDDFVIDSLIAHGGMASVYLARQLSMDRMVALKILKSKYRVQETFVNSFLKEAKSAARLNHPNIIQALAVGVDGEHLFYAMEYVKGETLASRIDREKNLDVMETLNIVQQCAEALHAAWTQEGLIHRDIKPDNIMLADDGYAKIMDLGIAVSKYDAEKAEISGTPTFMAPEQFRRGKLDCRTDIYSLGCTLFNALMGFPPFDGETVEEVAQQHLYTDMKFPDKELFEIPPRIKKMISLMLAKDPEERFQDYDELLEEVVDTRRRISPDDAAMVPSVHTISFSKFRLREELAESPSEIYRKRTDKKRKVQQAREQQKVAAVTLQEKPNRVVGSLVGTMVLLLVIICVLIIVIIQRERKSTIRPFASQAEGYVESHQTYLQPQFVNIDALRKEIAAGRHMSTSLPADATTEEVAAFVALQDLLISMTERLAALQQQQAEDAIRLLKEEQAKIAKEREQLERDRQFLTLDRTALDEKTTEVETLFAEANAKAAELRGEELANISRQQAIEAERIAILQPLKYRLQIALVDYLRSGLYTQADALLAARPDDPDFLATWRTRKREEYARAMVVINAVGNSGQALNGKKLGDTTIVTVAKYEIRYTSPESPDTTRDRHLKDLESTQLLDLAGAVGGVPLDAPTPLHLALCLGDYKTALAAVRTDDERKYVNSIISGCYSLSLDEVMTLQLIGQRTLAVARAKLIKQRYETIPGYETVEKDLLELLRSGTRTTPADPTPIDTPADAG